MLETQRNLNWNLILSPISRLFQRHNGRTSRSFSFPQSKMWLRDAAKGSTNGLVSGSQAGRNRNTSSPPPQNPIRRTHKLVGSDGRLGSDGSAGRSLHGLTWDCVGVGRRAAGDVYPARDLRRFSSTGGTRGARALTGGCALGSQTHSLLRSATRSQRTKQPNWLSERCRRRGEEEPV